MYPDQTLYRTPLSGAYWRQAGREMNNLRMLVFSALMIAMARALSYIPPIYIGESKFTFGFIARALGALVYGPVVGMVFGFAEDILGYILKPEGEFFIGYTISTMAGVLAYALCFYRAKITVFRLVIANVLVNVLVNTFMGSLWSAIVKGVLASGGYWAIFAPKLGKNLVTIAPKAVLLYVVFQAALPILQRMGLIPRQVEGAIRPF